MVSRNRVLGIGFTLLSVAALCRPGSLEAASTGTTALHTPQGGGAATANGDYIAGALNAPYRYFVEVPAGQTRLVVDIFDADVGTGGAAEATAGRDRDRGGYDTTATYSVFSPDGTARTTNFTTGTTALPATSDNAWLTLFDTTGDDVRDNFGAAAYTNNDGLVVWATNWTETNDDKNAGPGLMQITGVELRLRDDGGAVSTIEREANLSTWTGATLTFDFRTQNTEVGDQYRVQVSSNGGGAWTTLETFTGTFAASSRSYDISTFRATNTRIRFIEVGGYTGTDSFFVDNVRIQDTTVKAGHWEVQVDESGSGGDDINAIGLRAHDGTSGSGGTEYNIYFDSFVQLGVNPPASGTASRSYTLYPYITSGCNASKNDFDYDSNQGNTGSMTFTSRSGSYSQSYASTALSTDDVWRRDSFTGWTSDTLSQDDGIWTETLSITSYLTSGNYTNFYMTNSSAAANPPTTNPQANVLRVYLPNDAGTAPSEPYLEQRLTVDSGPNPPQVGQRTDITVTVKLVNASAQAITFSASNLVTANVPGSGAVYDGSASAQVSQGSITAQPGAGGTGNITWNPGTVAAGATVLMSYEVRVTPTSGGQRVVVTGTGAAGTRATFVDHTGNTTQTRATYTFGPICELAVTQGLLTQAVVSSFGATVADDGRVVVEWTTASEAGTAGFRLLRWDGASRRWVPVHRGLLPGLIHEPQGGTYRFVDEDAAAGESRTYLLEEVEVAGGRHSFGPYTVTPRQDRDEIRSVQADAGYERTPHPATGRAPLGESSGIDSMAADLSGVKPAAGMASGAGVHLAVRETGLYYVSTGQLAVWLGLTRAQTEEAISLNRLLLSRSGIPAAWYPDISVGPRGRGTTVHGLFFYGTAQDSLYTRDTVYRLEKVSSGLTMLTDSVPAAVAAPGGSFPESLAAETDAFPATAISPDPTSDYWFWEFLVSGDPTYGHKTFALNAPGLEAGGAGTLTVGLQGATATGVAGEHQAAVAVNGTVVGSTQWDGITARSATFDVPAGVLIEAGNQVEVTGTVGAGAPYSILYVDGFQLGYPRRFVAEGDRLAFTSGGHSPLTVSGFSDPRLWLIDVADPLRPRWVRTPAMQAEAGGTYRISFVPSDTAHYLAVGRAALKLPAARPWSATDLRSTGLEADVLIVVPPGMKTAAERLADQRRSQGLKALVVDLDEVADSFGEGTATPQALQDFLRFAWQSWSVPPRYVVLGGEGSLDYRDLLGYHDCVMPPLMIAGEGGLFPADNQLADADGDGMPEMAIGRIPVLTATELNGYIDKILAYEAASTPGWASNALMLADSTDGDADFAADSERLVGQLPSSYAADRIYLSSLALDDARTALLQDLGSGASLVNYLGHGGLDRLTSGGLLTSGDVAGLTNGERLPVVTAMTCTINRFAVPGVPSLGELLAKSPAGGAAAVWGPSGLSYHGEARKLAESFFRRVSGQDGSRLGDWILASLAEFGELGGNRSMLGIYNLLGDPSLLVRRGPEPAAGGGSAGE